jgi:HAMP domain-containing protein
MSAKRRGLSWRTKLSLLMIATAVLPIGVLTYWLLEEVESRQLRSSLSSLEGIANAKANALEQLTEDRTRDVERIASLISPRVVRWIELERGANEPPFEDLPELRDEQPTAPDDPPVEPGAEQGPEQEQRNPARVELDGETAHLRANLGLILWDQAEFEELLVIDGNGRVIASTFADHEERTAEALEYFQAGRRATHVQRVFMSPITHRLTMVIATPIRNGDAQEIGVLAARLNLSAMLALIHDATGLGDTGETVVGKIVDSELAFMAPTRHDPREIPRIRLSTNRGPMGFPVVDAALGQSGAGLRNDYRDRLVLAAWRPVPSLEWGLVVKMDEEEAMRGARELRNQTVMIGLGIVILAVLVSLLVSRELVRPLHQLKEATDRISRGDLGVKLELRSADEIGELADSFDRMVAAIKFFREHARTAEEDAEEAEEAGDLESARPEPGEKS